MTGNTRTILPKMTSSNPVTSSASKNTVTANSTSPSLVNNVYQNSYNITSANTGPSFWNGSITLYQNTGSLSLYSLNNTEIVRLNADGSVTWASGINIDEAAAAFARSLSYSAELKSGITKSVKLKMRDSIFEDLIGIAAEKGPLSVDDLTYLLKASKIVEKLKGGEDEQ